MIKVTVVLILLLAIPLAAARELKVLGDGVRGAAQVSGGYASGTQGASISSSSSAIIGPNGANAQGSAESQSQGQGSTAAYTAGFAVDQGNDVTNLGVNHAINKCHGEDCHSGAYGGSHADQDFATSFAGEFGSGRGNSVVRGNSLAGAFQFPNNG